MKLAFLSTLLPVPALVLAQNTSPPDWAGRAPDGAQPRIVVPAPENPRFHHLGCIKPNLGIVEYEGGTDNNLVGLNSLEGTVYRDERAPAEKRHSYVTHLREKDGVRCAFTRRTVCAGRAILSVWCGSAPAVRR